MRYIVAILLLLSAQTIPAGQVYKWVDENGKVHYGDRPQGNTASEMKIKSDGDGTASVSEAERRERRNKLLRIYDEERREAKEAAELEKKRKQRAKKNCVLAKHNLERLTDASYLYDLDENGERVAYSDEERAVATRNAEAVVKKWCK